MIEQVLACTNSNSAVDTSSDSLTNYPRSPAICQPSRVVFQYCTVRVRLVEGRWTDGAERPRPKAMDSAMVYRLLSMRSAHRFVMQHIQHAIPVILSCIRTSGPAAVTCHSVCGAWTSSHRANGRGLPACGSGEAFTMGSVQHDVGGDKRQHRPTQKHGGTC